MVSTEYPPMLGGVGHYTKKLVSSLREQDLEVLVVCNEQGEGEIKGLSPNNTNNSEFLLRLVKDIQPDLVHVQYEQGLYGMHLDPIDPRRTKTNIESFYDQCKAPIVSTFHSAYTFGQWMRLVVPLEGRFLGRFGTILGLGYDYWTHLINHQSFTSLIKRKIGPKRYGIVFSKYMANLIPGTHLIYHGAEPSIKPVSKNDARRVFALPEDSKLMLAFGFKTATKGWDLIKKIKVKEGWKIVVNGSKNHYNMERHLAEYASPSVIELHKGFLNDEDLSLLFFASDAIILPYKVTSGSGVMFDALAHSIPFISSDIGFFREFSDMGLGISVRRNPVEFSKALLKLEQNLDEYKMTIDKFRKNLLWEEVAKKHAALYDLVVKSPTLPC
ncbi:MAG TPA: glycosyltransferase [Nitrososphaeraceae archaeon]|jgi:glycosyltransferase involved in cell wall biosynthesis